MSKLETYGNFLLTEQGQDLIAKGFGCDSLIFMPAVLLHIYIIRWQTNQIIRLSNEQTALAQLPMRRVTVTRVEPMAPIWVKER